MTWDLAGRIPSGSAGALFRSRPGAALARNLRADQAGYPVAVDWWLPAFVAIGYVVASRLIQRSFLVWCIASVGVGAVIAAWWAVLLVLPDLLAYWVIGPASGHLAGWRGLTLGFYTFHAVLLGLGAALGRGAL